LSNIFSIKKNILNYQIAEAKERYIIYMIRLDNRLSHILCIWMWNVSRSVNHVLRPGQVSVVP